MMLIRQYKDKLKIDKTKKDREMCDISIDISTSTGPRACISYAEQKQIETKIFSALSS